MAQKSCYMNPAELVQPVRFHFAIHASRNNLTYQRETRSMRLLRPALAIMAVLLGVSNGITVAASKVAEKTVIDPNSIQTTEDISYHISTRQLSDHDFDEERARRIGGGDAMATNNDTPSNQVYGTHTSIGLMNSNGVTHDGECNRFTNWWKRLFNKSIKKCDEEDTRRLRS